MQVPTPLLSCRSETCPPPIALPAAQIEKVAAVQQTALLRQERPVSERIARRKPTWFLVGLYQT